MTMAGITEEPEGEINLRPDGMVKVKRKICHNMNAWYPCRKGRKEYTYESVTISDDAGTAGCLCGLQ